jgi:hypothetical protein
MRLCLVIVTLVSFGAVVGCGGDTTQSTGADMAMSMMPGDMTMQSVCGHPGDTGNSLGVGKYCQTSADCAGKMASACSTIMPPPQGPAFFCTMLCDINSTTNMCGENATCTCLSPGVCGCVPDTCRIGLFG